MTHSSQQEPSAIWLLIDTWRNERGFSDQDVARMMRVSPTILRDWKSGASAPNRNRWKSIAKVTGRSVEDIALAIAKGVQ